MPGRRFVAWGLSLKRELPVRALPSGRGKPPWYETIPIEAPEGALAAEGPWGGIDKKGMPCRDERAL